MNDWLLISLKQIRHMLVAYKERKGQKLFTTENTEETFSMLRKDQENDVQKRNKKWYEDTTGYLVRNNMFINSYIKY